MQTIPVAILLGAACWGQDDLGTWKMDSARSKFSGDLRPKSLTVRFEAHPKGELFTVDQVGAAGQATTFSIILYLDGKNRGLAVSSCSGTQSSRRVNSRTVEIVFDCRNGQSTRFIRRLGPQPNELVLDITGEGPTGPIPNRHLILKKQAGR